MSDLRTAAEAFLSAYSEHLNNHCPRCTAAYAELRAALEVPTKAEPEIPVLQETIGPRLRSRV